MAGSFAEARAQILSLQNRLASLEGMFPRTVPPSLVPSMPR